jgi:molybdate transport system regulatory protein
MPKAARGDKKKRSARPGFHGRVWIDGPEGTFIGHGRVVLLEGIAEHGSITKAAKSMQMAYRHAWDLVDSMNRQARTPFVELATGGKGGGGARVTAEGLRAIKIFWRFHNDLQTFLKKEEKKLKL